jgi:hypothetical protein
MMELTEATRERISALFSDADTGRVEALLLSRCGENLPLVSPVYVQLVERIRFAVLKLSDGRFEELEIHIGEASRDWRDVLMAAGFGEDIEAHLEWKP